MEKDSARVAFLEAKKMWVDNCLKFITSDIADLEDQLRKLEHERECLRDEGLVVEDELGELIG